MKKLSKFSNPVILILFCLFGFGMMPATISKSTEHHSNAKLPILYFEISYNGAIYEFSGSGVTSGMVTRYIARDVNGTITNTGTVSGTWTSPAAGEFLINISAVNIIEGSDFPFFYDGSAEASTSPFVL